MSLAFFLKFVAVIIVSSTYSNAEKRILIIHTTPWKVGTASPIQAELEAAKLKLLEYDIFVPTAHLKSQDTTIPDTIQPEGSSSTDLLDKMTYEIQNSKEKYVIISMKSYVLSIQEFDLRKTHKAFPSFDIKIVMFYRNPLEWAYLSYARELIDFPQVTGISFAGFVFHGNPLDSALVAYKNAFYNFENAFGKENVKIIDYDGVLREKVPVINALLSSLGIEVKSDTFPSGVEDILTEHVNAREMHFAQLWKLFDVFLRDKDGCTTYNAYNNHKISKQKISLVNSTTMGQQYSSTMPVKCLHLDMLRIYCAELDQTLRDHFGDRILYGNKDMTEKLMWSYQDFCQLDSDVVLSKDRDRWVKIFRRQVIQLVNDGLSCTGGKVL